MNPQDYNALDAATSTLEALAAPVPELVPPVANVRTVLLTMKPVALDPRVRSQVIDLRNLLAFLFQYLGMERYERGKAKKLLQAAMSLLTIYATDEKAGGVAKQFRAPRYKVYAVQTGPRVVEDAADIIARGTVIIDFVPTGKEADTVANRNYGAKVTCTVPDAWADWIYAGTIVPCDAAGNALALVPPESHPVCHLWLNKTKQADKCPWFYIEDDSFDWTHVGNFAPDGAADGRALHTWMVLPSILALPVAHPRPLEVRTYEHFSDMPTFRDMHLENMVTKVSGNGCRPNFDADGTIGTETYQGYMPQDRRRKYTPFPFLYGHRNNSTFYMATWLRAGHTNGCYAGSPWGHVGHILNDANRTVIPLLGWWHTQCPAPGDLANGPTKWDKLFGDWSRVPVALQRPSRVEGYCFNEDDIKRGKDTNVVINGDPVHDGRVRLYFADGDNGTIYCASARGDDPNRGTMQAEPYIVTVMVQPGIYKNLWGMAHRNGVLYACEREKHRVIKLNDATGALLGVWSDGGARAGSYIHFEDAGVAPGLAATFRARLNGGITRDMTRALDCCAPESINIVVDEEGIEWLSLGALATGAVMMQRLDRMTPAFIYCLPPISGADKSHMVYHTFDFEAFRTNVGTCGPAKSCLATTFSDGEHGRPVYFYPSPGTVPGVTGQVMCTLRYRYTDFGDSTYAPSGAYNCWGGRGGLWIRGVYAMAPAIGYGNIFCAGTEQGIQRISKALPTDPFPNYRDFDAAALIYEKQLGLRNFWGQVGNSNFDDVAMPRPDVCTTNPKVKYYLDWHATC